MEREKLKTYLGFARRAGKLTLGVQAAETVKKDAFLLVADKNVAPNNRKEIEKIKRRLSCPLIFLEDLEELTGKANCKLALLREAHLAEAIKSVVESDEP